MIGIGEIVLLPLDVLKIKRQTNPEAFRGRGLFKIVADEGFGLYRGWGWTAARNAPGSFAVSICPFSNFIYTYLSISGRKPVLIVLKLFGGSAFAKEALGLADYNAATWTQNFIASIAGASASLIVSAPLDVIKTRIQNKLVTHHAKLCQIIPEINANLFLGTLKIPRAVSGSFPT